MGGVLPDTWPGALPMAASKNRASTPRQGVVRVSSLPAKHPLPPLHRAPGQPASRVGTEECPHHGSRELSSSEAEQGLPSAVSLPASSYHPVRSAAVPRSQGRKLRLGQMVRPFQDPPALSLLPSEHSPLPEEAECAGDVGWWLARAGGQRSLPKGPELWFGCCGRLQGPHVMR